MNARICGSDARMSLLRASLPWQGCSPPREGRSHVAPARAHATAWLPASAGGTLPCRSCARPCHGMGARIRGRDAPMSLLRASLPWHGCAHPREGCAQAAAAGTHALVRCPHAVGGMRGRRSCGRACRGRASACRGSGPRVWLVDASVRWAAARSSGLPPDARSAGAGGRSPGVRFHGRWSTSTRRASRLGIRGRA